MRKELLPAYLLTLVNVLGFSILMPVLPFVVASFGADKWVYGLLLSLYSAFQFIGAPYLGALSDQRGRKPILLISQAGTLLSWLVFVSALLIPDIHFLGLALPLWVIILSRILDGVTGGNAAVTNAYVSDITTRDEKSYIFGYLGGIAGIGMIIGPGLGGFTASGPLGYLGTLLVAIGISILTLMSISVWLKESHPEEKRAKRHREYIFDSVFFLRRIRTLNPPYIIRLLLTLKFGFSIMMAFYISTIALFLIDLFRFDEAELGLFMLAVGIFLSFNQAFVSKHFIRLFGEYRTLLVGLVLCAIGLIAITLTDLLWLYIVFYYILNLGFSLCFPTFNGLIAIHSSPEKQGETMGVSESINSFAMALFPVIGAMLYGLMGSYFFWMTAAIPTIAFVFGWKFQKENRLADD